jgi:Fe-S cluster assembly protein SufD
LSGLTLATGNQLLDVHSRIVHASRDCISEQEQRNVLAGSSRVFFKGAVAVPRGSENTTANQLCRTLQLSNDSRVDVQPTLEIDTDSVECSHGATITDLDEDMLFYLQARGVDRATARSLILEGWIRAALEKMPSASTRNQALSKAAVLAPQLENLSASQSKQMQSI